MKLKELFVENFPDPHDVLDPQTLQHDLDANKVTPATKHPRTRHDEKSPRKDSNVAKAKRIRNLVRMKVRDVVRGQDHEDTSHTYNLGGHVSTFLNR